MRKTVRLYQRLYAFSKRTGSTATPQRIPSSEEREVGEPVGGRASHREAGAIGQGPTSGLEPLTPAPVTSERSVVAERCTDLQILHRQRVLRSMYCSPLQGIAFGLGSN